MVEKCEKSSFPFEAVHPHINICILLMKGMLIRALSLDFVIRLSKELHKYLLWTSCSLVRYSYSRNEPLISIIALPAHVTVQSHVADRTSK